ncbi:MAG: DUF2155 domain-containing protein, partial [Pseudomonadota bacterium]
MRALWLALALSLGLMGPATAQIGDDQLEPETEPTQSESRFKRAPFRTYRDHVGPRLPEAIEGPQTRSQGGVTLRFLDKMTGRIETVEVETSSERLLGTRIRVRADACRSPEAGEAGGDIAFLKIWDTRQVEEPAFSGWMFAESPSLSALDHPRYDVWVIRCITTSGET